MLGLKYGMVRLVAHDPRWREAFLNERAVLIETLKGNCEVEHIGSAAVPDLPAKPILDTVGIADSAKLQNCIAHLERVGYTYRGDAGETGGLVFVRAKDDIRTHHLHVVALGGHQWRRYLQLRDLLQRDERARETYAAAKQDLARRFADDRRSYTSAKNEIVDRLLGGTQHVNPA